MSNSRSNYSIGLQRLKPVHSAYGAICISIRKLLYALVLGTRRKWPTGRRLPPETETLTISLETRRWYVSRPRPQPCYISTHDDCTDIRPSQPSIHPGSVNEYQLRLGRQMQVWFIPLVDERGVCR